MNHTQNIHHYSLEWVLVETFPVHTHNRLCSSNVCQTFGRLAPLAEGRTTRAYLNVVSISVLFAPTDASTANLLAQALVFSL